MDQYPPGAGFPVSILRPGNIKIRAVVGLERFHNSRAVCSVAKGGIFLKKKPLEACGFGVQQLWNRYSAKSRLVYPESTPPESNLDDRSSPLGLDSLYRWASASISMNSSTGTSPRPT
jgi:hypothetical protein